MPSSRFFPAIRAIKELGWPLYMRASRWHTRGEPVGCDDVLAEENDIGDQLQTWNFMIDVSDEDFLWFKMRYL